MTPDALTVAEIGTKHFVALKHVEQGRPSAIVLSTALPKLITSLKFPLTMRWNESGVAFSRPIRWLLALHGDALVEVEYAGVPSDRYTYGLRYEGAPEILVERAESYLHYMDQFHIMVDPNVRRQIIWEQASALVLEVGGVIPDDPGLLDEVTHLVENPTAVLGHFESRYLSLPEDVLIAVMHKHQRYFPVRASAHGPLMGHFIAVANGEHFEWRAVAQGYADVLRARFADAAFFYASDTAKPLVDFVPQLAGLMFQQGLGSYLDKTERLQRLVPILAEQFGLGAEEVILAERTAKLCKADLVSRMVVEFTMLQGRMGRVYALNSGEDPRIAEAIEEHYLPRSGDDPMPRNWPGMVVGLADRLDSLTGLFVMGLGPTGTTDPYGLRRIALGVIQMLVNKDVSLSLSAAVQAAGEMLPATIRAETLSEVVTFIRRRLQHWLLDQGFRHDLVEAVLAERGDDIALAYRSLKALTAWLQRPEFGQLLIAYSRARRIVQDYEESLPLMPEYLSEPPAQRLYQAYLVARDRVTPGIAIDQFLYLMLPLVEPINVFFNDLFVMHEVQSVRMARLGLLQQIASLSDGVVDLSKVRGS